MKSTLQKLLLSKRKGEPSSSKSLLGIVLLFSLPFFLVLLLGGSYLLLMLQTMPNVEDLGKHISESTIILDREGNELYRLYDEENRRYVPLTEVSEYFQHAILAIEDKRFYSHPGIDISGLVRAFFSNVKGGSLQGASTITQQLVKNGLLKTNERSYDRKIKEAILAYQVERHFTKDKILELYVNQIPFGGNSHGIQMAAQNFFGKDAVDLTVAESAILASLPKGPTYYSPYGQNKHLLMGYCEQPAGSETTTTKTTLKDQEFVLTLLATGRIWVKVESDNGNKDERTLEPGEQIELEGDDVFTVAVGNKSYELYIGETKLDLPSDRNFEIKRSDYADLIASSTSTNEATEEKVYTVEGCTSMDDEHYVMGRKDFVLKRMVEDEYITEEQLQEAWSESHDIVFETRREEISAPHFVMYVREYLEEKYGENVGSKGYIVRTTIDPKLQQIAEEVVEEQGNINENRKGVGNAALVSIDPNNGQIMAMVGSRDYWDTENDGNVNVITRKRQPGSSFKPFMFAHLFEGPYGAGSVFWDVSTKFGAQAPNNYDGDFMGPMTVRQALAYSRNLPPIKAFFLADGEDSFLEFLTKMGFGYLTDTKNEINEGREPEEMFHYGWPLAIGTGEVRPLDMAAGYGVFATNGTYHNPIAILEVTTGAGEVIESSEEFAQSENVLDPQVAYQITDILSDVEARPASTMWRNNLSVAGQYAAAKTGTSNKRFGETILPSDLWTVGYTRHLATAVWAGNNDGSALSASATGLTEASPMWHNFMVRAHEDMEPIAFDRPEGLTTVSVSLLTGKRATEQTPEGYVRSGLFSSWSVPAEFDGGHGSISIDTRNNLLANEFCPPQVVKDVVQYRVQSERPTWENWEAPVQAWAASKGFGDMGLDVIPTEESPLCREADEDVTIDVSFISPQNHGALAPGSAPVEVSVSLDGDLVRVEYYLDNVLQYTSEQRPFTVGYVDMPNDDQEHLITVVAYDDAFNSGSASVMAGVGDDETPPVVSISAPDRNQVFEAGETVSVAIAAKDAESAIDSVDVYVGDRLMASMNEAPYEFSFTALGDEFLPGSYTISVYARDTKGNSASDAVTFNIKP